MKNLIILYFLFFSISSICQNISGKVYDKDKKPLPGVSIYFDGTTISTLSDENGNFVLQYDPAANNVLVVSLFGYENEYITGIDPAKNLIISMIASKNVLKEVIVNRKDMFTREQKMKIFKEFFIGKTSNSANVIIENENDIYFKYDKQSFVLKAFSDNPLVIVNPSLGYKINYVLQTFEVSFNSLSIYSGDVVKNIYAGVSHFEDIDNSPLVSKRREEAYKGSQLNFFRDLANNNWGDNEFSLFSNNIKIFAGNCFKISKDENFTKVEVIKQIKEGKVDNTIASYDLLFKNKEQSNVVFETNTFNIYKYGNNSNIDKIVFLGKIAEERIGEMLPLNYGIN